MKYVGIDLGTTNSAISSFDGEKIQLFKSPEQHDVTPSAIFIDRRGNKYVGSRAYNNAARNPDNAAVLFKRLMGTSTPVKLPAVNLTMTPEECSAEVLRTLFGYLPEEIRGDGDTGTVITVPAAFNQMQKDSTMSAADAAGLGRVALMQEPVAAVMSVMRQRKNDGVFVVYDLGGGTLDIAIAESIAGRVNLLAHGGIAMCGGRDFDRILFDNVVKPWLLENFDLPEDLAANPQFKSLLRMATWAAEKAKIELSQKEDAVVSLPETELGVRDQAGEEIYIDIAIDRKRYDALIAPKVEESIQSARETLEKAGLSPHDVERVVFVGGPTHYKPLRDKVAFELGIAPSTDVNPMTAVAEGAAVFAESIDWASQSRGRKSARGALSAGGGIDLSFNYIARTPEPRAKIVAKFGGRAPAGIEFQIDSLDTGWSSGRVALKDGASVELSLTKPGDNIFKVFVFDSNGAPVALREDKIVIARTAASIDAIPASHSIGVEARDKVGGRLVLDYLVREGDQLPKKGKKTFKAGESLKSGSAGSIKFKLWEGEVSDPINDNRFIGMFEIRGSDFDDGVIAAGAELVCEYEVLDSGNIQLEVSVPSISGSFKSGRNYYSSQEGKIDYSNQAKNIQEQSEHTLERLEEMASKVDDPRLEQAREKLEQAGTIKSDEADPETAKQAMDNVQEAKRLLALTRKEHLKDIRQLELDRAVDFFEKTVRQHARPTEATSFDNLVKTAQRAIENNSSDFESHLDDLRGRNFMILWRQDWFVIERFKWLAQDVYLFPDAREHAQLVAIGVEALKANDIDKLRAVVVNLDSIRIGSVGDDDMMAGANIVRS
ncbi:Hsp70 family protein [Pseudomonas aeruginosa]|jgi:molecular chaperone DnaK|uniref:Hsp70 family protein n=1 Tax=Pseudomonadota TaxID=1224 RepID=UPI0011D92FEE|nr:MULTISPECIES: Hsp70 family protein [Pseudomonadota]TXH12598.1 MAG: Hsp70 family protein [Gammaproteobacteria bacterium]MBV6778407.1 Hsp70 family protein [Xanthomonas campestris pv. carissae]MCM8600137.1 Hsp70 family protein [Accumulibacter sp.]NTT22104.1 Hsp70 family protein [Pseudomonas aeruginosa]HBN7992531.1 Hsp70 family protein [Pseudomonas aeruginosa]